MENARVMPLRNRQIDILPGPETQRLFELDLELANIVGQRTNADDLRIEFLDGDGTVNRSSS